MLSDEECDHLIELGGQMGLKASATVTKDFDLKYHVYLEDGVTLAYNSTQWSEIFKVWKAIMPSVSHSQKTVKNFVKVEKKIEVFRIVKFAYFPKRVMLLIILHRCLVLRL